MGVTYTCELCKQVFNKKDALKQHIDVKHNGLLFNCDSCQFKATRESKLKHHISVHHEGMTFDCNICQQKYNSKERLDHHIKKVHEGLEYEYECHECDGLFVSVKGVKRHVNMVHNLSLHKHRVHFKSIVYGAKTLKETIFSMMLELNSGWKCMHCGKESKSKNKQAGKQLLGMHIESEHMGITHTCEMCGHTYKTRDTYKNHLNSANCNLK